MTALARAKARLEKAVAALAPKHKGGEMQEYRAAYDGMLEAERALAAARREPHAMPTNFPLRWDIGAPIPHLLVNDHRSFLLFRLANVPTDRDEITPRVAVPRLADQLAVVEFERCVSAKLGSPNDEVNHGHPLNGKGFEGYRALRIEHSPWLAELRAINAVHECFNPGHWDGMTHYVFGFHDSTFECVAKSYKYEITQAALPEVLADVCARLAR